MFQTFREREALYGDSPLHRIISVPNGLWQAQKRVGEKGFSAVYDSNGKLKSPHYDPWENVGKACLKREASAIVFGPAK